MSANAAMRLICHRCGYQAEAKLGTRCPEHAFALVPDAEHSAWPRDPFLGRILGDKYPLLGVLGFGGFGSVYRGLQEPVGREVAVKVLRDLRSEENVVDAADSVRARFLREAQIVSRLSNPATVTLFDYGAEPDGVLYMVLELIKGRTLAEHLREEGPVKPVRAAGIARQVLQAVSEAHGLHLVHRDLKPHNIMLVQGTWGEERVKVLDFGIAKVLQDGPIASQVHTTASFILGTPRYMAPEQCAGGCADFRSDLYSLGVVLYELLVGQTPFDASTPIEMAFAHCNQPVPPFPSERQVPEAMQSVVLRALAKQPQDRFPDAASMAEALLVATKAAPPRPGASLPIGPFAPMALRDDRAPPAPMACAGAADYPAKHLVAMPPRRVPMNGRIRLRLWAAFCLAILCAAALAIARGVVRSPAPIRSPGSGKFSNAVDAGTMTESGTSASVLQADLTPAALPSSEPPPEPTPEENLRGPAIARREKASSPRGSLSINCVPWCEIFIDGRDTGRTSPAIAIPLTAGGHSVRVVNPPSGLEAQREVVIPPNGTAKLIVYL